MTLLVPGRAFATSNPQLHVENVLEPGTYRFQLVVVDDSQNESVPADLIVLVRPRGRLDPGNLNDLARDFINPLRPTRREG
jgi:hypothetical protein